MKTIAVIGVGPATGSTLCRQLSGRYQIAMVARSATRLAALEEELEGARAFPCDVADTEAYAACLAEITEHFGAPDIVVLNTESAVWGEYTDLPLDKFGQSFEVNVVAFLQLVQAWYPDKTAIKPNTRIIVSSSPGAYTPPAHFVGLAPSRVAQRVLAELLHENLAQHGLSFSIFSIDGAIDEPKMRAVYANKPTEFFIQQSDICQALEKLFEADALPLHTGISGLSSFAKKSFAKK